jgi:RNA polymerase sigma factor (sigma-70 family)
MNEEDFNTCVDLYSDSLYRYVLKMVDDKDTAKDIMSDIYQKLWTAIHRKEKHLVVYGKKREKIIYPLEMKSIRSYLFTLAFTMSIKELKRKKRTEPIEDGVDYPGYETNIWVYVDVRERVDKALNNLEYTLQSVLMLRDYDRWTYKEIGEVMQVSEIDARKLVFEAREALKKQLKKVEMYI